MLVGLCGRARAGKSVAARHLVEKHGFVELSFAEPLRAFIRDLLGVDAGTLENIKDAPHPLLCDKTPRYAMQRLGTEWGRHTISNTLWIDVCMRKAQVALAEGKDVVISDIRFDNEAAQVKELGGTILKILRPDAPMIGTATHPSERGISHDHVDAFVMNDTTPDVLKQRIDKEVVRYKKKLAIQPSKTHHICE